MEIESRPVHGRPWQYRFYLDLQDGASNPEGCGGAGGTRQQVVELRNWIVQGGTDVGRGAAVADGKALVEREKGHVQ